MGVAVGVASGAMLASGRATRQATLGRFVRTLGSNVLARMGRPHIADTGGALDWQRNSEHADAASASTSVPALGDDRLSGRLRPSGAAANLG